jgi:hypothetical protein
MKMKKSIFAFAALALVSCAKDKTTDEYQREKAMQNLALYESVAGNYSGVVTSKENGEVLGAMQLDLRADRLVNPPKDSDLAIGTPILAGTVKFLDETVSTLSAPNGFYDPSTGAYQAEILISRGGVAEIVTINGSITGATLGGSVQARGTPDMGGRFQLQKNGESIQNLLERARPGWRPDPDGRNKVRSFLGATDFSNAGVNRAVRAVILQPLTGTPTDILDLISPVKTVQVSFNYSSSVSVVFNNALFDRRQGLINGETVFALGDGRSVKISTECRISGESLRCNHLTASGAVARTNARMANGSEDPPSDDDRSVTKTFSGKGKFSGPREQVMKLQVTKGSKSGSEDIFELFSPNSERRLHVSFQFSQDTSATFTNARWSTVSGIVEGEYNGAGYLAQMQCTNFTFGAKAAPFQCTYWTSRSSPIKIDFKPPYN